MAKQTLTIFSKTYINQAKPKRLDPDYKDTAINWVCHSCKKTFTDYDPILITYGYKTRRRCLPCAISKNIIEPYTAKTLLEQVIEDMDASIKEAMKRTLAYQLYKARHKQI